MSVVNQVKKSGHMGLWDIVMFQANVYCHMNKIPVSLLDLECLSLLAVNRESELTSFCNAACVEDERNKDHYLPYEREIFKSPQSVRNTVNKLEALGLIIKKGNSKKKVLVSPVLEIQSEGNIFIDMKFLRKDETKEA